MPPTPDVIIDIEALESQTLDLLAGVEYVNRTPNRNHDEMHLLRGGGAGQFRELPRHVQRRAGARV